jgi:NADH-quinone oxidoreductase subunit D
VLNETDTLLTKSRIFYDRTRGVGKISGERASGLRLLRARTCARRASTLTCAWRQPYMYYDQVDFDVPIGADGGVYDRYLVRLEEMRQSLRIIEPAR